MKHGMRITFALAAVAMAGCTDKTPAADRVAGKSVDGRVSIQGSSIQDAPQGQPLAASTLCHPSENALFACAIEASRKEVAICASKDAAESRGYLYYAYGTHERKELIYPADKSPPAGRFKRTHLSFAGSTGGYAYSFENSGIKYIVYSIAGTEVHAEHGVIVSPGESLQPLSVLECRQGTVMESDDEELIDVTLEWDEDVSIARQGLPARN